jgi:hypothetical protein
MASNTSRQRGAVGDDERHDGGDEGQVDGPEGDDHALYGVDGGDPVGVVHVDSLRDVEIKSKGDDKSNNRSRSFPFDKLRVRMTMREVSEEADSLRE